MALESGWGGGMGPAGLLPGPGLCVAVGHDLEIRKFCVGVVRQGARCAEAGIKQPAIRIGTKKEMQYVHNITAGGHGLGWPEFFEILT